MQVFQREEDMNCGSMCRLQQSAAVLPPASAGRSTYLLRDGHNLTDFWQPVRISRPVKSCEETS